MQIDFAALERRLAALREAYIAALPARLDDLGQVIGAIAAGDADSELPARARLAAHSLKGSAGTHGLSGVSAVAGKLEALAAQLVAAPLERPPELMAELGRLMWAIRRAAAEDVGAEADPGEAPAGEPGRSRRIVLFEDDDDFAAVLSAQLESYGFMVDRVTGDYDALRVAVDQPTGAVLLDIVTATSDSQGLEHLADLRTAFGEACPPAVIVTMRDDFAPRLAAARNGAAGYFTKPVDIGELSGLLERLTGGERTEDARVLIIDDDRATAVYHAEVLAIAGFTAEILTEPLSVLTTLDDFRPDLLLLDMYMPECSGQDLAAAIRLVPAHQSLPIVFLSAEQDVDRQLAALGRGGDDFLVKPIRPDRLIASVAARAARMRLLREMATRDPMTRLLNHRALKERLAQEIQRARRGREPVSFALVDIDRFKQVNDVHGHPVGDAVIKSLARVLRNRLRSCDAVGRYGGEEFGVVLPGADAAAAGRVVDAVRQVFGRILHWSSKGEFRATFSAGVAALGPDDEAEALIQRADERLYAAKRGGRDQVVSVG